MRRRPIDRRDPLISPLFADLAGFPPLLIQVGSAETLLADATRLAEAAGVADVDVTLQVWPHMIHAWPLWNASLAGRPARAGRMPASSSGAHIRVACRLRITRPEAMILSSFCRNPADPANPGF